MLLYVRGIGCTFLLGLQGQRLRTGHGDGSELQAAIAYDE